MNSKSFLRVGIHWLVCKLACLNMLRRVTAFGGHVRQKKEREGEEQKNKYEKMTGSSGNGMMQQVCTLTHSFSVSLSLSLSLSLTHTVAFMHANNVI